MVQHSMASLVGGYTKLSYNKIGRASCRERV